MKDTCRSPMKAVYASHVYSHGLTNETGSTVMQHAVSFRVVLVPGRYKATSPSDHTCLGG